MTPEQSQTIGPFWSQVRQIEKRILENCHRLGPLDVEGLWNDEFEKTYETLAPLLAPLCQPQIFLGVSSLPHLRGPFEAENAHQALMFQLNPEEAMYGDPSLLRSEEYNVLRQAAEAEVKQLETKGNPILRGLSTVKQEIVDALKAAKGQPLRGKEIAERINRSYDAVRSYLPELMGMTLVHHVRQGYVFGPEHRP